MMMLRVEMRAQVRPEVFTLPRKVGLGDWPKSSPKVCSFIIVAKDGLSDKKKNDWLLVCGKIPVTMKGHRVVIKLCNAQYAIALDNGDKPGKLEGRPLDRGSERALKGLGRTHDRT